MRGLPIRPARLLIAALLLTASIAALAQPASKITERSRQRQAVESERAELREKLVALKHAIDQIESARGQAADALADAESAISKADRALYELAREQRLTQERLERLTRQHSELAATVAAQQNRLATLLRGQYAAGSEDRLKLLLSGDNPHRIQRELHYFGYVSQAQASLIEALRLNLQAVERNQAETRNARDELDEIAQEQQQQKTRLEAEKSHRVALLAQLAGKLAEQRKQAGHIAHDEQRLSRLVDRLSHLIEEQKKAEAATREKRRQEQLAKSRAAEAKQRATAGKQHSASPDAIDDDELRPQTPARNELTPPAGVQAGHAFGGLRGHLRLPVAGSIAAKFGSRRGDGSGPSWKGLFIRTAEGAPVKAVADGRVVFADWLRGFGNLIIVDHGSQYLTIYGNNQALLKRPGDQINGGETIARAGNTGGNEESGLYFEMRYQGRAFDPLGWVTTR